MTGLQQSTRLTWQDYAEHLNGRILTVRGIQVKLEVALSDYRPGEYTTEVIGWPTDNGKTHPAYVEQRREFRDDWVMVWTGDYPIEIIEVLAAYEYQRTGRVYQSV